MNRRDWLKRASQLAAAGYSASQIDAIEAMGWVRRLFPSAPIVKYAYKEYALGFIISQEMLDDDYYPTVSKVGKLLTEPYRSISVFSNKDLLEEHSRRPKRLL